MEKLFRILLIVLLSLSFATLHAQHAKKYKKSNKKEIASNKIIIRYGLASYYANKFHGRKTANGETYKHEVFSAACNAFPLNTWLKVTNLKNNRSVIVRINDRLHAKNKRLLDLSKYAAEKLGYVSRGVARVKVEVLKNFHVKNAE